MLHSGCIIRLVYKTLEYRRSNLCPHVIASYIWSLTQVCWTRYMYPHTEPIQISNHLESNSTVRCIHSQTWVRLEISMIVLDSIHQKCGIWDWQEIPTAEIVCSSLESLMGDQSTTQSLWQCYTMIHSCQYAASGCEEPAAGQTQAMGRKK